MSYIILRNKATRGNVFYVYFFKADMSFILL